MQLRYFDTSVILSLLFSDKNAERALELWEGDFARVSSTLLRAECYVNFHKYLLMLPEKARNEWKKAGAKWLSQIFGQFYLHEIDGSILELIASNSDYGRCRTLDAIHLASASIFAHQADAFAIATFDVRMKEMAKQLGFSVIGN